MQCIMAARRAKTQAEIWTCGRGALVAEATRVSTGYFAFSFRILQRFGEARARRRRPAGTSIVAPLKSSPTGSNRPPRCSARNASVTALNDLLFSGRRKPWPSSGIEHVGDRDVLLCHRLDDLVGFQLLHARVVGALADEQRLLDLVDQRQRRALRAARRGLPRCRRRRRGPSSPA